MVELDFSRVRLLPGFTPRRLKLPSTGVTVGRYGDRSFELSTSRGSIKVGMGGSWYCRGTKDALIDYGLIAEDWLPGTPGNNTWMQIVLFMPDGQIALGSWKGGRPPGYPSLRITRHSGRTFTVTIPYTEEEREEFEKIRDARNKAEVSAIQQREAQRKVEDSVQMWIGLMAKDGAAARERVTDHVTVSTGMIKSICFEKGYRLKNEKEINLAIARLISEIERSPIVFEEKWRREEIEEIRRHAANLYKADLPLKPALKLVR